MQFLTIILLCVAAAIFYGVVQDNVTARICVEYFSIFHPRIVESSSPTVLAFVWGVLATWWVGLGLGVPLALASRVGSWPMLTARELIRPVAVLLAITSAGSLAAGVIGYKLASMNALDPGEFIDRMHGVLPPERRPLFFADLAAHQAAYGIGALGGLVLCAFALIRRRKRCK